MDVEQQSNLYAAFHHEQHQSQQQQSQQHQQHQHQQQQQQQQRSWQQHLLQPADSSSYHVTSPTSPTDSTFSPPTGPPLYFRPHPSEQQQYPQSVSTARPSSSGLSLNLSSLSVEPSAPSPHGPPNANGSLLPISSDVAISPVHSSQPHIFPSAPFAFGTPPSNDWASSRSTSSSDIMRSETPISAGPRPAGLRQSTSMDEILYEQYHHQPHYPHHLSHQHRPQNIHHNTSFSSSVQDDQMDGTPSSFPDSHAESPVDGSASSDPPDDHPRSIDGSYGESTSSATTFTFTKFDNSASSRQGTAAKAPSTNNFVTKLYQMISDPNSTHYITWTELGSSFVVSSVGEFSRSILGSHFKHNNFSSFVRQLNMYGFHKINRTPRSQRTGTSSDNQVWEFSHSKFLRGRPDLLDEIKRKALETESGVRPQRMDLPSEVAQQLTHLHNKYQTVMNALETERTKVDRLTSVVKSLYDIIQQTYPGHLLPFPLELLDSTDTPPILITAPSDPSLSEPARPSSYVQSPGNTSSASSEVTYRASQGDHSSSGTTSATSTRSFWSDHPTHSLSASSLGTISPSSSPTSIDFPQSNSLPSNHGRSTPLHAPIASNRAHLRHALPRMNIPSLPRFDASIRSSSISSPGTGAPANGGDDSFDAINGGGGGGSFSASSSDLQDGRSSGPKRQRMNSHASPTDPSSPIGGACSPSTSSIPGGGFANARPTGRGGSSAPSSSVHLVGGGDQQRQQVPSMQQPQSHGSSRSGRAGGPPTAGRTLARARSDSAPHGMALGQVWQGYGSSTTASSHPPPNQPPLVHGNAPGLGRPRSGTQHQHQHQHQQHQARASMGSVPAGMVSGSNRDELPSSTSSSSNHSVVVASQAPGGGVLGDGHVRGDISEDPGS